MNCQWSSRALNAVAVGVDVVVAAAAVGLVVAAAAAAVAKCTGAMNY